MSEERIVVGKWRCSSCDTVNSGNDYKCKSCGNPRPEDVEFFLEGNEEFITDEEKIKEALEGPDWLCEYCSTANKASAKICKQCGNAYDGVEKKNKVEELTDEEAHSEHRQRNRERHKERDKERNNSHENKKRFKFGFPLISILIIGIIISSIIYLAIPKVMNVKISRHYWKKTIDIEQYKDVKHSDWHVPSGARVVSSHMDIYSYKKVFVRTETKYKTERYQSGTKQVKTGQTNLGNGKFKAKYSTVPVYSTRQVRYTKKIYKSVPIYKLKYVYIKKEWAKVDTKQSQGYSRIAVAPKFYAKPLYRIVNPTSYYAIIMKDKENKVYKKEVSYNAWIKFKDGEKIKIKVGKVSKEITILKN